MKESRSTTQQDINSQKRLGIGLLLAGILVVAAGIPFFIQARQFNATAIHTPGKIVEMQRQQSGKDVSYYPVFSFTDKSGAAHTVHSRLGSSHPGYAVGDAVEVLYPADDPESAKLNSFLTLWTWPAVFGGVGFVMIIASLFFLQGAAAWARNEAADARKSAE
jgi:hypothetical protein